MPPPVHTPVLLEQTLTLLAPQPGEVFLDCTVGLGGHAAVLAQQLTRGTVILCDLDNTNLQYSASRVKAASSQVRVETIHGSFASAPRRLTEMGLKAHMILADLGFASNQVDDPQRGLSFSRDGPLDMRLDVHGSAPSAADLVNTLAEADLARIIDEYGEERHARRVATRIIEARREGRIETTAHLADIVRSAVPRSYREDGSRGIDPATRTFQALRMAVNDELGHLAALLDNITDGARRATTGAGWLAPGARIAIISFHSLEDRPVKRALAALVETGSATALTRKPAMAQADEVAANPRARSAKLRAVRLKA